MDVSPGMVDRHLFWSFADRSHRLGHRQLPVPILCRLAMADLRHLSGCMSHHHHSRFRDSQEALVGHTVWLVLLYFGLRCMVGRIVRYAPVYEFLGSGTTKSWR